MNEKIKAAQAHIDGLSIAKAQMEFQSEFRDVYPFEVLASSFMAVGPMQSFLGFCAQQGYLTWTAKRGTQDYDCDATIEAAVRSLRAEGASWVEIEQALFDEGDAVYLERISEQEYGE